MNIKGKTVVVTGGTGFLGRHLVDDLQREGDNAIGLGTRDFDLRERDAIHAMLDQHRPAAVIHLAAVLGGIGINSSEPGRLFYENAVMGIELIEACRIFDVTKTIIAGTIASYPADASLPFIETDFWKGYPHESEAAFALAKKMLLAQVDAYRKQYGMNLAYLVPVNLYGPGDSLEAETSHVIPAIIRKFLDAKQQQEDFVTLWGDGSPTREFLFVDDAARAFRLALQRYDSGAPLNIGSGDELAVRDIASIIKTATGFEGDIRWDKSKPNGQPRRRLYDSSARRLLEFEPTVPIQQGIRRTVEWAADELVRERSTSVASPCRE